MTRSDLIEKTGYSKGYISGLINEKKTPTWPVVCHLAMVLGVNRRWLAGHGATVMSDEGTASEVRSTRGDRDLEVLNEAKGELGAALREHIDSQVTFVARLIRLVEQIDDRRGRGKRPRAG